MSILIENVSKNFGSLRALRHVNLEIPTGTLTALVGPSGSGKSTLLRLRAGFESPDTGRVWLHGQDVTNLPPAERELGVVFQSYALFPHLTVWENVAFGLERRGVPVDERTRQIKKTLNLVGLESFAERFPSQLSGGQRQRVALARALALKPRVLLLDEPFAALDPKVRRDLREWLRDLHKNVVVTTLLVTHDQQEAREVADQLVVFRSGRIEQAGPPREVYDLPANGFVRGFVGHASPRPDASPSSGGPIGGLVRPHGWELSPPQDTVSSLHDRRLVEIKRICYGETLVQLEVETENKTILRLQLPRIKAQHLRLFSSYWLHRC
jgi:sulfate transport system ATP-binding protein